MNSSIWSWVWGILFAVTLTTTIERHYSYSDCKVRYAEAVRHMIKPISNEKSIIEEYIKLHNKALGRDYVGYLADTYIEAGKKYKISPFLLVAISLPESGFDSTAISHAGAIGIMQIMPFWVDYLDFVENSAALHDPYINIHAGAYIISHYINTCGGLREGVRCYHGGPRAIVTPKQITLEYEYTVISKYKQFRSI